MLKNDLFLRALKGEPVRRPPVWMMRQAGRYLPDFMTLKNKYDFFTRCKTPELATEITLMPIDQIGPDAAILFSDILVVLQAMQIPVEMKDGVGPWIPNPIKSQADVDQAIVPDIDEHLGYVMEAIKMTQSELNERVPLIGFAGSPWTLLCYAVQGQGSKTFDKAKAFCFSQPEAAHALLQKITDTTILYLKEKVKSGVHAVQLFDSWGGLLSPSNRHRTQGRNTGDCIWKRLLVCSSRNGKVRSFRTRSGLDLFCEKCPLSVWRTNNPSREFRSRTTAFTHSRNY